VNYLLGTTRLSNHYFVMRHGHSLANQQGIIVSRPENGVPGFGLSKRGESQVSTAIPPGSLLDMSTMIISSDFKRARESAEVIYKILKCETAIRSDVRLRERNFGSLELSTDDNYARVWNMDESNPDNQLLGVESPNQVMRRVSALIAEYETDFSGKTLLLVSHGDALQILQTAFQKQDASRHRSQQHLKTAEIRPLKLSSQH
jgi:broad specificity phosphatase PhoE